MRELLVGAQAFGLSRSQILDYRLETRRGWLRTQVVCVIVTGEREFRGSGRSAEVAVQDAIEAWERHFLLEDDADPAAATPALRVVARQAEIEAEPAANDGVDESGYMSSQVFSRRRSAVRFAPNMQ